MTTTIALVTGGNKGIGQAVVRRLAGLGWTVVLAARDAELGAAAADELGVETVQLDVTDDRSVEDAARTIDARHGRLDVLVNNAGIGGGFSGAADATADEMRRCFETNVFGQVRVTHAFLPLLRRSAAPRIVMVSSGLSSFGVTTDPSRFESKVDLLHYPASKAALNMITSQYAKALPEFRINAVAPGNTSTDLNGHQGAQTVEEGSDAIVEFATVAPDGPTGGLFDRFGPVAW